MQPCRARRLSFLAIFVSVIVFTSSISARAQEGSDAQDAAGETDSREVSRYKSDPKDNSSDGSTAVEMETLKRRIDAMEASLAKNTAGDDAASAEIEALKQHIETFEMDEILRVQDEERKLKFYGFADIRWFKTIYYQDDEHYLDGLVNGHNTFIVGHWNLFAERQLSDSFRAMGEVRFLFQPLGHTNQYADPTGAEFDRTDVNAVDNPDAYFFNWGGISIERIWIEFKPSDYFGVKAGKFLTPYSMWNVDHSPTVLIPIHTPYLITGKYIPPAQTGLYLFGRAFPSNAMMINYGLTLSNGEGPTTEFYDLDDKKALGASLGVSWDGPVKLDIGSYFYMGDYTDLEVRIASYVPMDWDENITVSYKNKAFSTNLKLEWNGLLLQGEYMRGVVRFQNGKRIHVRNPTVNEYEPDCIQWATYALLGYRLPFDTLSIMPFLMYEYVHPPGWADTPRGHLYGGGINWRINPFVVLKAEFYHQKTTDRPVEAGDMPVDYHVINTQLAVTY